MKKIIMTINQSQASIALELLFIKQSLTKRVVDKREVYHFIDKNAFFKDDLKDVIKDISVLILANNYKKVPLTINLNLANMFVEEIDLPKLSLKEQKKAIGLELEKHYSDFNKRFLSKMISYKVNGQLIRNRIYLFDIYQYNHILMFAKKLKHRISKLTIGANTLYQSISKYRLCDFKQPFVFVNISSQTTTVLVVRNKLVSHYLVSSGIEQFPEEDSLSFYRRLIEVCKEVASELKKVLYHKDNVDITNVYLNIEALSDDRGHLLMSEQLDLKVLDTPKHDMLPYLGSIGAINLLNFSLPLNVNIKKDKIK